MLFGSVFWFCEEIEEFCYIGICFFIFILYYLQVGFVDNGVLWCIFCIGVVRYYVYVVVKFGVFVNVGKRIGRGGGYCVIIVIEFFGGFIFMIDVVEVVFFVYFFEYGDVFYLFWFVEFQYCVCVVKVVVFVGKWQIVSGVKVFQLDLVLLVVGVVVFYVGGFQFCGIVCQILSGFWWLFWV